MDGKELVFNTLKQVSGGQSLNDLYPGGENALRQKILELKPQGVTFEQFCSICDYINVPGFKETVRRIWESC